MFYNTDEQINFILLVVINIYKIQNIKIESYIYFCFNELLDLLIITNLLINCFHQWKK